MPNFIIPEELSAAIQREHQLTAGWLASDGPVSMLTDIYGIALSIIARSNPAMANDWSEAWPETLVNYATILAGYSKAVYNLGRLDAVSVIQALLSTDMDTEARANAQDFIEVYGTYDQAKAPIPREQRMHHAQILDEIGPNTPLSIAAAMSRALRHNPTENNKP